MRQKTFDDSEPVLEFESTEPLTPNPNSIEPRSRTALQVYDEIEAARLIEDDPLF